MNKLRNQIILSINLFLLIVMGCFIVYYNFFAQNIQIEKKKASMEEAFESIKQMELNDIREEDEEFLVDFDETTFSVLICNDEFEVEYYRGIEDVDWTIENKIKNKTKQFRKNPNAKYYPDFAGKPVSLRGLIRQNKQDYYVFMTEKTRVLRRSIVYAREYLVGALVVMILLTIPFSVVLARSLERPLGKIKDATEKMAKKDYSVRILGKKPKNEIGVLAENINDMAATIQNNISDLDNYNYLLLKQNKEMLRFEEMRKKLIGNMTHQLKTPLAIISSQVELMQEEKSREKKEYYYQSIMEEIDKMSTLISSILKNSKVENEIMNIKLKWGNLSDLLLEMVPKYESWFSSKNIHFVADIQRDCMAYFDRMQIEQAINNYVTNAFYHTKADKSIVLSLEEEEKEFVVSVYNEGTRLPESELENIWTSFYQIDSQKKENGAGIGLGLYIVKDIARQHNGVCGVENCAGGVRFFIKIPKKD